MKIRRINFYGGPGIGKTSIASGVFSDLKWRASSQSSSLNFEVVQEYVKTWAWQGKTPKGFDQIKLFTEQLSREEEPLRCGVDLILSDSPLLLNYHYGYRHNVPGIQGLKLIHEAFEATYPSLNIILTRGDKPYNATGRFQTKAEAEQIDKEITDVIQLSGLPYLQIESTPDISGITNRILETIDEPNYAQLMK